MISTPYDRVESKSLRIMTHFSLTQFTLFILLFFSFFSFSFLFLTLVFIFFPRKPTWFQLPFIPVYSTL